MLRRSILSVTERESLLALILQQCRDIARYVTKSYLNG